MVTVTVGDSVTLACVAHGSPLPDITWFRNGDQMLDNQTVNALVYESFVEQSGMIFVQSILELCPVEPTDAGEYSCFANSTNGNHTAVFQVIVPPRKFWNREVFSCSIYGFISSPDPLPP